MTRRTSTGGAEARRRAPHHGGEHPAHVGHEPHERAARPAAAVADGDLGVAQPLPQEVEGEDLRVVVVVRHLGDGEGRRPEGPEARLGVGQAAAGGEGGQGGEDVVARPAVAGHVGAGGEAVPDDVVGLPVRHGREQPVELRRVVLPVGVEEGHGPGPPPPGLGDAGADGGPEASLAVMGHHVRPGTPGQLATAIGGPVVDHDHLDGARPERRRRHPGDDVGHRRGLVVHREHDDNEAVGWLEAHDPPPHYLPDDVANRVPRARLDGGADGPPPARRRARRGRVDPHARAGRAPPRRRCPLGGAPEDVVAGAEVVITMLADPPRWLA